MENLMALKEHIPQEAPLQPFNDVETLWNHAAEAQKILKEKIASGTEWASTEMTTDWAESVDAGHVGSGIRPSRRARALEEGAVPYVDVVYDPGLSTTTPRCFGEGV